MSDVTSSDLHLTELGDAGPRVVFFHGLFGQGKNWTHAAKQLAGNHRVTLVDMPNHGRSGWTEHLDYIAFADQLAELFSADDPVRLVGHSMGGKIAMVLALRHPDLVERLVVVDIAPVTYPSTSEFAGYIKAMQAMDLDALQRRSDADAALFEAVPNRTVRSFLLQNLRHDDAGWRWQPNLELLGHENAVLGRWPEDQLEGVPAYDGKVLWIAGTESAYITDDHAEAMVRWFPRTSRITIKKAGHWVHSQQPEVFQQVLERFLAAP
ncbi:alpha/beta fold hydrolase [Nocardioides sp. JQ2195]|uniref:alpha/beta fold hydrolase n=1 Tax=Nocardioides sp. JQ2195 TaxID=2592334 RepID=UPI00143EDD90|nr:alpha/beta fold hydrolase [Nocardioides sp. JQ2195]QIX27412.1 alpha/beta fold hydrolase [Nocardioides sp. JQ2195]